MATDYFSLLFFWASVVITGLELPNSIVTKKFWMVRNFSFSEVRIGKTHGTANLSRWHLETTETSNARCEFKVLSWGSVATAKHHLQLLPSTIVFNESGVIECNTTFLVTNISVVPKNGYVRDTTVSTLKGAPKTLSEFICNKSLPFFVRELRNRTVNAPTPPPALPRCATPLNNSVFIRGVANVLNGFPGIAGVHTHASLLAGTTLRVTVEFRDGFYFTENNLTQLLDLFTRLQKAVNTTAFGIGTTSLLRRIPFFLKAHMELNTSSFIVSAEISLHDLQCDKAGVRCSLPAVGGVGVQNIRLRNLSQWDRLVTNHIGPALAPRLNKTIQGFMDTVKGEDSRVSFPEMKLVDYKTVPPTVVVVSMLLVSVFLLVGAFFFTIWRHQRDVVTTSDGSPMSLKRALLEDMALMTMVVLAAIGFAWSNSSSIAVLVVGDEFPWFALTLYEPEIHSYTVEEYVFAFLLFFFCGVYPYIKLLTIVICTLILRKPDVVVLKVIDYFGKFSLMGCFAMGLMLQELQVGGVSKIRLLPAFYIFLVSAILSIIVGNYATTFWRRDTSLRQHSVMLHLSTTDTPEPIYTAREGCEEKGEKLLKGIWNKGLLFRILYTCLVFACILPAWVAPCVRYSVTGLASLLQPVDQEVSLWGAGSVDWFFLITCIFTIGVAPVVYVFMYPRCSLLAPWCTADVFLLTCVSGATQLGGFVKHAVGKDLGNIYGVRTWLLWPLIPLFFSTAWQWALVIEHTFDIRRRLTQCLKRRADPQALPFH